MSLVSEKLERTNFSAINKLLDKYTNLSWPIGKLHDNILLSLTDAAPCTRMVKAANDLKSLYSKMIHVKCSAHVNLRIVEKMQGSFKEVDELISNAKRVFLKTQGRI